MSVAGLILLLVVCALVYLLVGGVFGLIALIVGIVAAVVLVIRLVRSA